MKLVASVSVALAIGVGAPVSAAQTQDAQLQALAIEARDIVLRRMESLVCGSEACEPISDEEVDSPPLNNAEALEVAEVAVVSAIAEHCGLDWANQSYLAMMRQWRQAEDITNRKLAVIGATHGVVQSRTLSALQSQGPCSNETRGAVQARLDRTRD